MTKCQNNFSGSWYVCTLFCAEGRFCIMYPLSGQSSYNFKFYLESVLKAPLQGHPFENPLCLCVHISSLRNSRCTVYTHCTNRLRMASRIKTLPTPEKTHSIGQRTWTTHVTLMGKCTLESQTPHLILEPLCSNVHRGRPPLVTNGGAAAAAAAAVTRRRQSRGRGSRRGPHWRL